MKKFLSTMICLVMSVFAVGHAQAHNAKTIALVMKALSNPFFITMRDGAKEYAKNNKIPLDVFGTERETEIDQQIKLVENLISGGYGAIVIAPADSKKLVPICKKALDQGIVVINIDNPFHQLTLQNHGITIPFVGSSNRQGAQMVGEYLKQKLQGKGNVVVIEGIRGVENAELRKQGFIETVTSGSQIKVVASETANWHTDEAFTVALEIFQKHRDIDAVFTANDSMALGVLQAQGMLGTEKRVWIGSYDNIEEVRNEMSSGRIHATIEQHPELMGAYGVELAHDALHGKKIPDYVQTKLDLITYEGFGKKIGVSISHLKNPFFADLLQNLKKTAALHGIKVIDKDAHDDDAQQLIDIQDFVEQKVDAIVVNPTHAESVSVGIEFANAANIPVITVDRKALQGKIISHITSDNINGGMMAGQLIVDHLKGKGNILELEGIPGTSATHDRSVGFNKALKNYKDIKIARTVAYFDREKSYQAVKNLLEQGKQFDAIFAHNDNMILGAIDAYSSSHEKLPFLVGFDAIPEALAAIEQGKLDATIAQNPSEMGEIAVESIIKNLREEQLSPVVFVELSLIQKR